MLTTFYLEVIITLRKFWIHLQGGRSSAVLEIATLHVLVLPEHSLPRDKCEGQCLDVT